MIQYHLVQNKYSSAYIIIRTPDYKCTNWYNNIKDIDYKHDFNIVDYNYGAKYNKDKLISEALDLDKLILSFIGMEELLNIEKNYPELFI